MPALLLLLAVPYFISRQLKPGGMLVGFAPSPAMLAKAKSFAASRQGGQQQTQPSQRPAQPTQAGPSPAVAMATMGPAGLLMTPQGRQGVAKGISLLKNARKGDKKSQKRVKQIQKDAARGDPKARNELATLQAADEIQDEVDEADGMDDGDELDSE